MPQPGPAAEQWAPTPDDLAIVGPAGVAFVERLLARYDFGPLEGELLIEAAHCVSALTAVRELKAQDRPVREHTAIQRLELAWSRQLAALVAQLRVEAT